MPVATWDDFPAVDEQAGNSEWSAFPEVETDDPAATRTYAQKQLGTAAPEPVDWNKRVEEDSDYYIWNASENELRAMPDDVQKKVRDTRSQITPEMRKGRELQKSMETIRWGNDNRPDLAAARRGEKRLVSRIPFAGAIAGAAETLKVTEAARRFESGEYTPEDVSTLANFLVESEYATEEEKSKPWYKKVQDTLLDMIPYAVEFAATGGVYAGGRAAAQTATKRILGRAAESAAGRAVQAVVPRAAGVAAQSLANPQRLAESTAQQQLSSVLAGEDQSFLEALPAGVVDTVAELGSERAGGIIGRVAGRLIPGRLKSAIAEAWMRQTGRGTRELAEAIASKTGWNGVVGELGEERVGEVIRGAFGQAGVGDFDFGTTGQVLSGQREGFEQLGVEAAAFAVPGAVSTAAQLSERAAERLDELRMARGKGFVSADDGRKLGLSGATRQERLAEVDAEIQQLEQEAKDAGPISSIEAEVRQEQGGEDVRGRREEQVRPEPAGEVAPARPEIQPVEEPAPEAEPQPPATEPPIPEGMTRLYHGSAEHGRYTGPAWYSTDREYAANYRENAELQYVDVPTEWANQQRDPDGYGQTPDKGFTLNLELQNDEFGPRRPLTAPEAATAHQQPTEAAQEAQAVPEAVPVPETLPEAAQEPKPADSGRVYREASIEEVDALINPNTSSGETFGGQKRFWSDNRDLAIGQGGNRSGVIVEIDPAGMDLKESAKPGTQVPGVGKEFVSLSRASDIRQQVRSVEITPNAKGGRASLTRVKRFLEGEVTAGRWTKSATEDGGVVYSPVPQASPQQAVPAKAVPEAQQPPKAATEKRRGRKEQPAAAKTTETSTDVMLGKGETATSQPLSMTEDEFAKASGRVKVVKRYGTGQKGRRFAAVEVDGKRVDVVVRESHGESEVTSITEIRRLAYRKLQETPSTEPLPEPPKKSTGRKKAEAEAEAEAPKTKLQQAAETATKEESAAERAQREADERRPSVESMGFIGGGRFKGERVRTDEIPDAMKAPERQEVRLEAAHGYQKPSMLQRVHETLGHLKSVVSRAQEHIPATDYFASANEFFRLLKNAPHKAQDEAIRSIAAIVDPLGPKQLRLFERLSVMENLSASVALGQPLRFGFQSQEDVDAYRDKLRDIASRVPEAQKAIDSRKKIVRETVEQLVEYGLLPEEARNNAETYYHQQVHFYMLAHGMKSGGRRPGKTKRSFQKRRVLGEELAGEEMDYNTSYIEAESSWMTDALMEIEKERLFRELMGRYDSKQSLKDRAKRENFENVVGGKKIANRIDRILEELAESRASEDSQDSAERARRKELIEELESIDPTHPFRTQIAKMSGWFKKSHGLKGGEVTDEDTNAQFWARVKEEANKGDIPALSLLKAIRKREEFIRETLGNRYATWETLADQDEKVDIFQPEPGNVFYRAFTLPERIVEQLEKNIVDTAELSREDLRTVLALGGPKAQYVVPNELADQLSASQKVESPHGLSRLFEGMMRGWKVYTLLNPKRALAYNLRNMTGDLDPIIAADPSLVQHTHRALTELKKYHDGNLQLSEELRRARDLGVIGSGFVAEEVPDISELPVFRRFMSESAKRKLPLNPVQAYFDTVKKYSQFREDVMRYATFMGYRQQLRQGRVKNYGGSNKAVVDRLKREMGVDVAAAHLARNLLGDYGNITVAGDWLRRRLLPFWSFQEINLKRVPRLVVNAWESGGTMRTAGALSASAGRAILMSRIAWMYGALWVWNHLIQGGDEEEELTGADRATPHIILGRNPDGSIRVFRRVGAMGDFLEWFGINEAIAMWPKYKAGQVDVSDIIWEMAFATPEKLMFSMRPDLKALYEVPTGTSLFPEPFQPRSVERGEAVSSIFGLQDEYQWAKGWALKDGSTARPHYWQRLGIGVVDPRHSALTQAYDLRNAFLKTKGKEQEGTFPVSRYKDAREAAMFEDYGAFADWKRQYVEERGDKAQEDFRKWLGTLDPIASRLNDSDELEFEKEFLTNEQRDRLTVARNYAGELRDLLVSWWDAESESSEMKRAVVFAAINQMDTSEPARSDYKSDNEFQAAMDRFTVGNERALADIKAMAPTYTEAQQLLTDYYVERYGRLTESYNAKSVALAELYAE